MSTHTHTRQPFDLRNQHPRSPQDSTGAKHRTHALERIDHGQDL